MQAVPFIFNEPQDRANTEMGNMDIFLKARQEGISSLIIARFAWDFLTTENMTCVIISHEDKATQRLFDRAKYFIESLQQTFPKDAELPYKLKYNSKHEMINLKKNSKFYVGTAGARAFGHGETINKLHCSELSRWPNQETMMIGLMQAVPKDGSITIETTANGFGDYFYKLWKANEDGRGAFKCHFIPWFELKEYVYPTGGLTSSDLVDAERDLMDMYHLTMEQISWRRWKISQMGGDPLDPNTWDSFKEQFPSNAKEAFIMSGNTVWSPTLMDYYLAHTEKPKIIGNLQGYDPVSIDYNEKGYLKIWKEPDEFHTYAIGVDVSEGKTISDGDEGKERDASVAQVFDKTTYEQVAVWYGRIDPDQLGVQLNLLGKYYNNALIGVERNAVGLTPLIKLRDLGYPNLYYREQMGMMSDKITAELGWTTTNQSKEALISDATILLRDKYMRLYDEDTIGEMMSFVRDSAGHAHATNSAYDDRVMSMLIGIKMLSKAKSISTKNEIEKSDEEMMGDTGFLMDGNYFNKDGMPTNPMDDGIMDI